MSNQLPPGVTLPIVGQKYHFNAPETGAWHMCEVVIESIGGSTIMFMALDGSFHTGRRLFEHLTPDTFLPLEDEWLT